MFKLSALLAVISVGFMVWCLVEAISTDGRRIRNLPKVAWLLLILLLPVVGGIAWLLGGRPSATTAAVTPGPDRATRRDARNPAEEAADFTTRIRQRAEEQRRRYEQQKKDKDKPDSDE